MIKDAPQKGWGGHREGAGGKPQPRAPKTPKQRGEAAATASELARQHAEMAIETLVLIASEGFAEQSRVAAAKALLEFGYGKPAPAASEPKEQSDEAAQATKRADDWSSLLSVPQAH